MVAQLLSFTAVCPLTDRRKTWCKSELFLKNPQKYLRGFFGGVSRKRRVWGGNPNKYLTGGQMSEKRNLVHWSIFALRDCKLPFTSVRHFSPVCINAFCKFSFAYYSFIGSRFWQSVCLFLLLLIRGIAFLLTDQVKIFLLFATALDKGRMVGKTNGQ